MIFKATESQLKGLKMMMWERVEMPASEMKKDANGKTEFVKTGGTVEMTTYHFRDTAGEKISFSSMNNSYRDLEGAQVDIEIEIKLDGFTGKLKNPKLVTVTKLAPAKQG